MTQVENLSQHRSTAAFATLLEKLGTAFSAPNEETRFSPSEAKLAGAFIEDAVSDSDVMESVDGH